jgi:predicted nuclease of restriction endonuclease-like (RecB) superfamily
MKSLQKDGTYPGFLKEVKELIRKAQYDALRAVNKELIQLYWNIGKKIVDKQETLGWGKSVVEQLSIDLKKDNPGLHGFSPQNLWFMRQLYIEYKDKINLQPLVREIGWTHNLIIFSKCKNELEREFFLLHVKKFGWTKNVLIHQIENKTYEKYLLNQTNFDKTLPVKYRQQAKLAVKDEYTFDFLELTDEHSEHELEIALIRNVQKFLTEMGSWYTFVGSQYRLQVGKNEYFIDLLLFHRKLKSLIAVELKAGEFQPEYKGKMEFYLTALNHQIKEVGENDAIGIIICKGKDRTVVEYSLSNATHPIGVATYKTLSKLPVKYKKYLPSPKEISQKLEGVRTLLKSKKL